MADKLPSFIRAIEVWRPDGDLLQLDSGAYGDLTEFESASVELILRKNQGLPGACWATKRPEVWHTLGERFVRADSALEAGIGAAVALPFFHGSELVAVVAFYCGTAQHAEGCIEVWESNGRGELEHADGYYGRLAAFEQVSRQCKFPRGVGLPGLVFQYGTPQIIDDLKKSNSFLRAAAARESGVASGLGFPIYCASAVSQVVLFLSAEATPLARAFEIWTPQRGGFRRVQGYYSEELASLGELRTEQRESEGGQLLSRVQRSALPFAVSTRTRAYPELDRARELGVELAFAFPVDDGQKIRAVVVMFI